MFEHNIDPVLISIFGLQIRYYGLVYALGLIVIYLYLTYMTKRKEIPNFKQKDVDSFLVGLVLSMIFGARLFHVFVYNTSYYVLNPIDIIKFWEGGLSFHGALTFMAIWIWYFAKNHDISLFRITDALVIPISFFLGLGRIANFVNAEIVGTITNSSIGVKFPGYEGFRHPVQLYESAENFIIFFMLIGVNFLKNRIYRKFLPGLLTAIFLISYGALRFLLEFYKEGKYVLFNLKMGQILSLATLILGLIILLKKRKK